ncbi:MAG: Bax inhibitor-1/YccA family protein [Ectothiorhodospiraceae bacterium]
MSTQDRVATTAGTQVVSTNKVIRNTYTLLSLTLLFSALTAGVAMMTNAPPMPWFLVLGGYFGLLFLTNALRNSVWGLASVFALTGFMGYTLGPLLTHYLTAFSNGPQIVMTAFGGTAAIFIGLSAYALTTRKDFSFMGGFLFAGILVGFLAGLGAMVFQLPGMMLGVSALFVLLMSAFILYQTSALVHGGETNYIMATVGLYIAIYNLFTSLLHLLGAFGGE